MESSAVESPETPRRFPAGCPGHSTLLKRICIRLKRHHTTHTLLKHIFSTITLLYTLRTKAAAGSPALSWAVAFRRESCWAPTAGAPSTPLLRAACVQKRNANYIHRLRSELWSRQRDPATLKRPGNTATAQPVCYKQDYEPTHSISLGSPRCAPCPPSVVVAEEREQVQEQVHDVEVELRRAPDRRAGVAVLQLHLHGAGACSGACDTRSNKYGLI